MGSRRQLPGLAQQLQSYPPQSAAGPFRYHPDALFPVPRIADCRFTAGRLAAISLPGLQCRQSFPHRLRYLLRRRCRTFPLNHQPGPGRFHQPNILDPGRRTGQPELRQIL